MDDSTINIQNMRGLCIDTGVIDDCSKSYHDLNLELNLIVI